MCVHMSQSCLGMSICDIMNIECYASSKVMYMDSSELIREGGIVWQNRILEDDTRDMLCDWDDLV